MYSKYQTKSNIWKINIFKLITPVDIRFVWYIIYISSIFIEYATNYYYYYFIDKQQFIGFDFVDLLMILKQWN